MLYAGSDDGIYRLSGVRESTDATAEKVLDADRVYRVKQVAGVDGFLATTETGLYYSADGAEWRSLSVPEEQVYAVTASPTGERLYAGTRPARLYVAETADGLPTGTEDWSPVEGFQRLREWTDWGIPRHDGMAQVRSLETNPDAPERLVAGIEVGGVHVSDDGGETWQTRHIGGFDAPHTDDIHHLALADSDTFVASTGSGLYRTTDAGRSWTRLDTGHTQRYVREATVHDGTVYAGVAPSSSSSWAEDDDHALLAADGERARAGDWPAPETVPIGWCAIDGAPTTVAHDGTVRRRDADGWQKIATVPTQGSVRGRYIPLCWVEG
jgi:hypothetical protein